MAAGDHYLSRSNEALCVSREFFFSLGNCAWTNKTNRSSESSTDKRGVERGKEKTWNGSKNSREKPIPLFKLKRSCYKREGISNEKKKRNLCVHYVRLRHRSILRHTQDIHKKVVWIIERHFGWEKNVLFLQKNILYLCCTHNDVLVKYAFTMSFVNRPELDKSGIHHQAGRKGSKLMAFWTRETRQFQ